MNPTLELLRARRTIRLFQQKTVEKAQITEILECARMSSCGANLQRLRYIVAQEEKLVRSLFTHTRWGAMVQPHRTPEWGVSAPLTFIAVTAAEKVPTIYADAGAAIQTIEYAAWSCGIGCCWLGSFDEKECSALLALAEDQHLIYLVALGYPQENPIAENADHGIRYYLDGNDRLHVPKLPLTELVTWR